MDLIIILFYYKDYILIGITLVFITMEITRVILPLVELAKTIELYCELPKND